MSKKLEDCMNAVDSLKADATKLMERCDAIVSKRADAGATERGLEDHHPRIVHGVKGVKSTPFKKRFPHQAAQDKFFDHPDKEGNYEIHHVEKDLSKAKADASGSNRVSELMNHPHMRMSRTQATAQAGIEKHAAALGFKHVDSGHRGSTEMTHPKHGRLSLTGEMWSHNNHEKNYPRGNGVGSFKKHFGSAS